MNVSFIIFRGVEDDDEEEEEEEKKEGERGRESLGTSEG